MAPTWMRRISPLVGLMLAAGCSPMLASPAGERATHVLTIRWQRLVDAAEETCPRCATTEDELGKAVAHLRRSLAPVGVDVDFQSTRIAPEAFAQAPLESNRIWIGDRALEAWVGAQTASSPCCDACGDQECRTVCLGTATYEAIPAALIVRAGFLAAGEILRGSTPPGEPDVSTPRKDGGS